MFYIELQNTGRVLISLLDYQNAQIGEYDFLYTVINTTLSTIEMFC